MDPEFISASDLERFGYCPLSWWQGRSGQASSESLKQGTRNHENISDDLMTIMVSEKKAGSWERAVLWFSAVSTLMAIVGFLLTQSRTLTGWHWLLTLLSVFWVAAVLILIHSVSAKAAGVIRRERQIAVAGIVAMVVALNAVTLLQFNQEMASVFEVLALIWLMGASSALYYSLMAESLAKKKRAKVNVDGKVLYVGTDDQRLLISEKYKLTGRPDYILMVDNELIPVDLKTGRQPRGPLFSHILQIGAYCLLLSDENGKRVSRGILKYGDVEHEIEFDDELESLLLGKLAEMRGLMKSGEVHRNHHRVGKCVGCSRRENCPERLG
ncbi:MAG TPA: CRISPR-associated protein Cas4 [Methanomassiliicoccales archaeon]